MNEITDQLWLTDIQSVRESAISHLGIDRVVNVCEDSTEANVGCAYDQFPLADGPHATIFGGEPGYDAFAEAADCVFEALNDGETVLVHCHAGVSRSVAVSMAALGRFWAHSVEDTYEQIRGQRPLADPCPSLWQHAEHYEDQHRPRENW